MKKRRKFFDDFAKLKKFSPLDTEKWYSITRKEMLRYVSEFLSFAESNSFLEGRRKCTSSL
jgi:hypothetical protein